MGSQGEDPAQQRQLFSRFLDIGMDLARRIQHNASAAGPTPDDALAFERVARAIRRTILLIHRLDNPPRKAPNPRPQAQRQPREPGERPEADRAASENEHCDDIGNRPTPEIVALIQRDLALAGRSTPEHAPVAQSEAPTVTPPTVTPPTVTAPATPAPTHDAPAEELPDPNPRRPPHQPDG